MELREELEDIADCSDPESALLTSILRSAKCISSIWQALSKSLTTVFGLKAADRVRKLKFIAKLKNEIELVEDKLLG